MFYDGRGRGTKFALCSGDSVEKHPDVDDGSIVYEKNEKSKLQCV
jgi:hypothetical protein